jgi:L-lysine 6-transaminase
MHAENVHEALRQHQLADGLPLVFDLERSHGAWLHDAREGVDYLDAFTCFASWPIGYNHPGMRDAAFREELLRAASIKPANSDLYTREMADFVATFARHVTPESHRRHHFWIEGGALAVENALKAAFDWKARKLGRTAFDADVNDLVVLHFREAFHGRSGYTLSLTNTDPVKIGLFPRFHWPRVSNPKIEFDLDGRIANDVEAAERAACAEIEVAFARHPRKVAAIIVEPLQSEGGDNHFRSQFLRRLRQFADEHEALLVFDEVQTGFWSTGSPWYWQQLGVEPDLVAFAKKTQMGGCTSNRRIEEVAENVFARAGRINSTWGGNLTDMVRARRLIEIVVGERLADNVTRIGARVLAGLRELGREREEVRNVRGIGSMIAFTCQSGPARDQLWKDCLRERLLALKCGPDSLRLRLPFVMSDAEADQAVAKIAAALPRRIAVRKP